MFKRNLRITNSRSFFLFGARATGKSTFVKNLDFLKRRTRYIDLLEPAVEEKYSLNPQILIDELKENSQGYKWVLIDEVQKVPKLLDAVHYLIESTDLKFALTGSSSRKLKRVGANLLAGRAFRNSMFPLTCIEMGKKFSIQFQMNWGSLPEVTQLKSDKERSQYLRTYYETYIREEIVAEQLVRNLNPFRLFLPICMQNETNPLNFTKIAEQTGVDTKTVQNYYDILIDTHLGFYLNSFDRSLRSVQIKAPKFYFFDIGVRRAIEKQLSNPVVQGTSLYGTLFESWFINECYRLNEYGQLDYKFSYFRTKDDAEIDLIIERPDGSIALVEIKSAENVEDRHLKHLNHFQKDFPEAEYICVCNASHARTRGKIKILPWSAAFRALRLV